MSFDYEDSDLDFESELQNDALSDYGDLFTEEDFRAIGVDPAAPTPAKPGSEDKVSMLAARYAAGLPLWHHEDCYDHGPSGDLMLDDQEEEDEEDFRPAKSK